MPDGRGWRWFGAWVGVGVLLTFSLFGAASIGLFVAPIALVALWAVARSSPPRRSAFGLLTGAGLTCLGVWVGNGGSSDGFDATPFLVAGIVLALVGGTLFALMSLRGRPARVG